MKLDKIAPLFAVALAPMLAAGAQGCSAGDDTDDQSDNVTQLSDYTVDFDRMNEQYPGEFPITKIEDAWIAMVKVGDQVLPSPTHLFGDVVNVIPYSNEDGGVDAAGEDFARGEGLAIASVADPAEALRRLSTNQVDAVLYDAPILQSRIFRQKLDRLTVLPELVREEDYALALPRDSRLRKPINQALLRVTEAPQWQETLDRYLGAQR